MTTTNTTPPTGSHLQEELGIVLSSPFVKYVEHLLLIGGLTAVNAIVLALLQNANTLNVANLPIAYQGLAYVLLPALVLSLKAVQQNIATELAQAQAAKAMVEATQAKQALLVEKSINTDLKENQT